MSVGDPDEPEEPGATVSNLAQKADDRDLSHGGRNYGRAFAFILSSAALGALTN